MSRDEIPHIQAQITILQAEIDAIKDAKSFAGAGGYIEERYFIATRQQLILERALKERLK